MELINGRYKILECIEKEHHYSRYIALDLLQEGKKIALYLVYDTAVTRPFIEYCNNNFYEISSYQQDNIVQVYSYGIVETIDGKQITEKNFFYTTEHITTMTLTDIDSPLEEQEILDIYRQIARALDFFHYHGIIYKYIGIETVKIIKSNDKYIVKLLDIVNVYRIETIKKYFNSLTYSYMAPEIERGVVLGNYTDIYSLGALLYYLLTLKQFHYNTLDTTIRGYNNYEQNNLKFRLLKLIRKMTSVDTDNRYKTIHECNSIIKEIYGLDEVIENIKDMDKINFKIPLIGRGRELKQILATCEDVEGKTRRFNKDLILINGDEGIGKTRLLKEASNLMKWDKYKVFSVTISNQEEVFKTVLKDILKHFIKIASEENVARYGNELVKLVPELATEKGVMPSKTLPEEQEQLRLYDRVANFILDISLNHTIALLIDDLHLADKSLVEFIDYLLNLNKIRKAPLLLIVAYRDEQYYYNKNKDYINKWTINNTLNIRLSRLTIEETAKMIKHILGWHEEPLNYAGRIMADTEGIPGHIEYVMNELYSQDLIKIEYSNEHKMFAPKINLDDYDKIMLTQNIDGSMMRLLQSLNTTTREILDIVSLFNTAISKDIIAKMLQLNEGDYDDRFLNLTQINILCEKFDDWGYTYGFCNSNLKKYIYNNIGEKGRTLLHIRASNILEELYIKEGRENKDELIYHFIKSNQKDKAIDYCIQSGINMLKLFVYGQSYNFFKRAYELLDNDEDGRKLTVVFYLAEVSQNLLKNNDAIYYLNYAIRLANLQKSHIKFIDAKNKIAMIYLARGEFSLAKEYLNRSIDRATKTNYNEGIMEAAYLLTEVYMQTGEFNQMRLIAEKYFDYASKQGNLYYTGMFMLQRGGVEYTDGNTVIALQLFRESIRYLEKTGKPEKASKPINNIGVIYNDYFQDTHNARLHFERALKISEQSHKIDNIINFNNNIAESYIIDNNYYNAINILKKNLELAYDYGDEISILLIYTNLIKGYTNIGEYEQAYMYLLKGRDICKIKKSNNRWMCLERYAEACADLYMALGDYNKALIVAEEFSDKFPNTELSIQLRMKKIHHLAKCYSEGLFNNKNLIELIESYKGTYYIRDRRMLLLQGAVCYTKNLMTTEAIQLLEEDSRLIDTIDNEYFRLKRKYIESFLLTEEEQIDMLEDLFSNQEIGKLKEFQWKIHVQLGNLQLKQKQYYRAASNFLEALSIIYVLFNKVPLQFRKSYILKDDKFAVRDNLLRIGDLINSSKKDETNEIIPNYSCKKRSEEFLKERDLEEFFNLLEARNILKNEKFYELALENYDKVNKTKVANMQDLLQSLTNDNIINLNFLLQLACRTTLASSGVIIIEYDDKYKPITTVGQGISNDKINDILDSIANTNNEIITKNNLDVIRSFDKDTKALIIIPIYKEYGSFKHENIEINKRKNYSRLGRKVIGYLYLETNKALNNFSDEALQTCKTLVPLASILITNYQLTIFSSIDKLTGTYVRKYFEQIFDEEIQHARINEYYLSIIMLDIDHFKNVNDTYGHQKGDAVLSETGRVISESVRSTDYVGRYGGEEFIVLLPNANKEDAYNVAEKIRKRIEKSNLIGNEEKLTISCGTATYPQDGSQQLEIIEKADQALYMAKENGRNQTVQWKKHIDLKNKRVDKLAGIVTGNIVRDQRNVLVITEIIELISSNITLDEKIYAILGRLSEILEAESSILFTVTGGKINREYYRKRFVDGWAPAFMFNKDIVREVVKTMQGKYTIDWEHISNIDPLTNTPNWKSIIVVPIIVNNYACGAIYLSVPIKEKEFDYNAYNLVKITSNIVGAILRIK